MNQLSPRDFLLHPLHLQVSDVAWIVSQDGEARRRHSRFNQLPRPIIDAHDAHHLLRAARFHPSFETAQYRVVARRHTDALDQALSRTPAHAVAEKINDFGHSIGASRSRSSDLGRLQGEGLPPASSVSTLPALGRSFTVAGTPCAGRSRKRRSCQPYRRVDLSPQSGQMPDPPATPEISHGSPIRSAVETRTPCPRDQFDLLCTRSSYCSARHRSRAQQKVRQKPLFAARRSGYSVTRSPRQDPAFLA